MYVALTRGAPRPLRGRIESQIGRTHADRRKMAVLKTSGRLAITDYRTVETFGPQERPLASQIECRLHTGRQMDGLGRAGASLAGCIERLPDLERRGGLCPD